RGQVDLDVVRAHVYLHVARTQPTGAAVRPGRQEHPNPTGPLLLDEEHLGHRRLGRVVVEVPGGAERHLGLRRRRVVVEAGRRAAAPVRSGSNRAAGWSSWAPGRTSSATPASLPWCATIRLLRRTPLPATPKARRQLSMRGLATSWAGIGRFSRS